MTTPDRPKCANPFCTRPAMLGKRGRVLKYCADPNCRKQNWYHTNVSAQSRQAKSDILNLTRLEVSATRQQVEFIKSYLLENSTATLPQSARQFAAAGTAPDLPELVITQAKSDENPGFNMMISMAGLTGHYADLPTEVLEYGRTRGRVPAIVETILKARQMPAATTGNARAIAGANLEFESPNFEDLEIDWS